MRRIIFNNQDLLGTLLDFLIISTIAISPLILLIFLGYDIDNMKYQLGLIGWILLLGMWYFNRGCILCLDDVYFGKYLMRAGDNVLIQYGSFKSKPTQIIKIFYEELNNDDWDKLEQWIEDEIPLYSKLGIQANNKILLSNDVTVSEWMIKEICK